MTKKADGNDLPFPPLGANSTGAVPSWVQKRPQPSKKEATPTELAYQAWRAAAEAGSPDTLKLFEAYDHLRAQDKGDFMLKQHRDGQER